MVSALPVHLVFVTNYQHGVPGGAMLQSGEAAMRNVCSNADSVQRASNGENDHVHLPVEQPPLAIVVVSEIRKAVRRRGGVPALAQAESPTEG